uniref:ST6 N-acetylgalactosaminide alpha-2,6-sialyltransferase 6 n=1 Tax=Oreochromis niloticus TaxID=8128 RepID=A0A669CE53_ORENI
MVGHEGHTRPILQIRGNEGRICRPHLKESTNWDSLPCVFQSSEIMTMQCHNCAFLTSSGHILGSGVGDEIDHTECVICINDAPTTGYESDVGGHSSVSYVFRNPNEFLRRTDSHSVIIFWGPPYKIRKDPKAAFYGSLQRVSMTYRNISYLTVTPSKMLTFDDLFLRETGYDQDQSHSTPGIKKVRYHYYDRWWVNECATYFQHENRRSQGQHRFITEKRLFARWAKQYNITFTHPRW